MPLARIMRLFSAWMLVLCGAVLTPTPLPLGIVMMALGLCLVARESKIARGNLRRLRGRFPGISVRIDRIKHRLPALLLTIWNRTDPQRRPRFGLRTGKPPR